MAEAVGIGTCAVHSDRPAVAACVRCGNFACSACLAREEELEEHGLCAACRSREGVGQIAWEKTGKSLWRRYAETTSAALRAPTRTFSSLDGGKLGPAAGFAALSSVTGFLPLVLLFVVVVVVVAVRPQVGSSGEEIDPLTLLLAAPCTALFYPALSFFYFTSIGVLFHVVARALGGRASIDRSLRAAYYSSAWEAVSALAWGLYCVPLLGILLVLGVTVGAAVWRGIALKAFAEKGHGLSSGSATVAAVVAAGTWLTLWLTVITLVVGFAIYQRFNR